MNMVSKIFVQKDKVTVMSLYNKLKVLCFFLFIWFLCIENMAVHFGFDVAIFVTLLTFQGTQKTLILQEIPEDVVKKFLSNKECLAACDVAVFLYDR